MGEKASLTWVSPQTPILTLRYLIYISFLAYAGVLLAFSDIMGLVPVSVGGIRFYGADLLFIFIFLIVIAYGIKPLLNNTISFLLFLFIVFGVFSALYGALNGYPLREVIGAFRRLFFYALAFGITWIVLDTPRRTIRISWHFYGMAIPVVVFSVVRLVKGESWNPIFSEDDLRAVSFASATILFWVFYDSLTKLMYFRTSISSLKHILGIGIVSFTLLISNYRLLWLIPIFGTAGVIWISWVKGYLRIGRFIKTTAILIISLIITVLVLKVIQNQTYMLIERKFFEEVLGFQFEGSFRYFVWGEAWSRLQENWLLGTGIGDRLEYELLNSLGDWYTRTSTTHNILLEVLYQTGIVGWLLFIMPHLVFLRYVWKNLRKLPPIWAQLTITFLFTYLSMFGLGQFQPFLTVPSVAILFYFVMGATARIVFWGKNEYLNQESKK